MPREQRRNGSVTSDPNEAMTIDATHRKLLLELVYDLLDEEEAAGLRARIDAEPEWAAAYAEAQRQARLLGEGARLRIPPVLLQVPVTTRSSVPAEGPHPGRGAVAPRGVVRANPWTRGANWGVVLAAAVLVAFSLGGYLYHRDHLAEIAAEHARLVVVGPNRVIPGLNARFTITTTSVTGEPLTTPIELTVYDREGQQVLRHMEQTDEEGRLVYTLPGELTLVEGGHLEIEAVHRNRPERLEWHLLGSEVDYVTHLTADRTRYRPGETVRFRSVSLIRGGLALRGPLAVVYEVVDAEGAALPNLRLTGLTDRGVGNGALDLPEDLPPGDYALAARSLDEAFAEVRRPFTVRDAAVSAATAGADIENHEGELETVDVAVGHNEAAALGEAGNDGGDEAVIHFFPEGGVLVPDVVNRVYFTARDPLGNPLDLSGAVLDGNDQPVARAETVFRGMGVFSLKPRVGEEYRLRVGDRPELTVEPGLPPVATAAEVALRAEASVVEPGEPLRAVVRSTRGGLPLVVAAWCQGILVGQQPLTTVAGDHRVSLPVEADVAGVVHLVVYDGGNAPPRPLAARAVYRQPARRLAIAAAPIVARPPDSAPERNLTLRVSIRDETGRAAAALLGASAVDVRALAGEDRLDRGLVARFLLAGAAEDDLALRADEADAAAVVDLILASREWSAAGVPAEHPLERPGDPFKEWADPQGATPPPTVYDNLGEIRQRYFAGLARLRAERSTAMNALTTIGLLGGIGLLLLTVMLSLMNLSGGLRLWTPAVVGAAVGVGVGVVLLNPAHLRPVPDGLAAFASYRLEEDESPPANAEDPVADGPVREEPVIHEHDFDDEVTDNDEEDEEAALVALSRRLRRLRESPQTPPRIPAEWAAAVRQWTFPVRTLGHWFAAAETEPEESPTFFWHPLLAVEEEVIVIEVDVPESVEAVMVRIEAHDSSGRLGAFTDRIRVSD